MNLNKLLIKYYKSNSKNMRDYYNLVTDMIDYFDISKFVKGIEIYSNLSNAYALYDCNRKKLLFGNNIFENNQYNENCDKAFAYIMHEMIHIIQLKTLICETNKERPEYQILSQSFFDNDINYSSILPIHEYQAFINSNYLLLKFLTETTDKIDINNCCEIIKNLLYNNYYDEELNFTSPVNHLLKTNANSNPHNFILFNDNNDKSTLEKLLFGMPVEKKEFNEVMRKIKYNKRR